MQIMAKLRYVLLYMRGRSGEYHDEASPQSKPETHSDAGSDSPSMSATP